MFTFVPSVPLPRARLEAQRGPITRLLTNHQRIVSIVTERSRYAILRKNIAAESREIRFKMKLFCCSKAKREKAKTTRDRASSSTQKTLKLSASFSANHVKTMPRYQGLATSSPSHRTRFGTGHVLHKRVLNRLKQWQTKTLILLKSLQGSC